MSGWDKIHRIEMELAAKDARIRDLEASLELARRVAVNATHTCAMCGWAIVHVPFRGEAS